MAFKINVSHNGKTYKVETENEFLVGKRIGETVTGNQIDENLGGYELVISGTSDLSGIPGFKGLEGPGYHRKLLTRGPGMKDTRKGLRLRKTLRGEEISSKTHQINIKVVKEGDKKFDDLVKKEDAGESSSEGEAASAGDAAPAEEKNEVVEEVKEDKAEEAKEEKVEEKKEEVKEDKADDKKI